MAETAQPLLVFYGGTFDPVHLGHLAIAAAARDRLHCPVRLLPAADPPHREPTGADAHHRAAMLALALEGHEGLEVDLREIERGIPSRNIDTLHEVRAATGEGTPIALVVGSDSFRGLPGWKGWPALFDMAHWVVADRAGGPLDGSMDATLAEALAAAGGRWTDDPRDLHACPGGRVLRLEQPLHPASASRIRSLRASGGHWQAMVPETVAGYIVRHRLYMAPGAGSGLGTKL